MSFQHQKKTQPTSYSSGNSLSSPFIQKRAKLDEETTQNETSVPTLGGEIKRNCSDKSTFFQPRNTIQTISDSNLIRRQSIKPGDNLGQATSNSSRNLVSDLTSPIVVGSKPRYELRMHGDEVSSTNSKRAFKWTVHDKNASKDVLSFVTIKPTTTIKAVHQGNFRVTSTVLSNGKATASKLSLDQKVIAQDASLTKSLSKKGSSDRRTYKELINDFKAYIEEASVKTGSNGITSLFLASVLFIEITHRGVQRQSEIEGVEENLSEMIQGESQWPWEVIDRSLGVGQINMSTAAMVTGATKWVDQDKNNRSAGRSKTESNFKKLSIDQKVAIFTMLKWPKSNIIMAAKLLTKLKNRSNRFPNLTKKEFGSNEKAASVIASEYNLGPSNSISAQSASSWYGKDVWKRMQSDTLLKKHFKNE